VARAEQSLAASLGAGKHVSAFMHDYLYFEPGVVDQLRAHPAALRTLLDELPGVRGVVKAYWRDDLEANRFDADTMGRRAALSFDRDRSGFFRCVIGRELTSGLKALLLLVGRRGRRRLLSPNACTEGQRQSKTEAESFE